MSEVILKHVKKIYPITSKEERKSRMAESNLHITDEGVVAVEDFDLTIAIDHAIGVSIRPRWQENFQRAQNVRAAIYAKLITAGRTEAKATEETEFIFDIAKRQPEYDHQ